MEKSFIKERIEEKSAELERFLAVLEDTLPSTYEEYKEDEIKKAACERFAEKIIQAIVDISFLIIRYYSQPYEKDDSEIFAFLESQEIIGEKLAKRLHAAKGMRNFPAHEYGEVNDEIVFDALQNELSNDASEFLAMIKEKILEKEQYSAQQENGGTTV